MRCETQCRRRAVAAARRHARPHHRCARLGGALALGKPATGGCRKLAQRGVQGRASGLARSGARLRRAPCGLAEPGNQAQPGAGCANRRGRGAPRGAVAGRSAISSATLAVVVFARRAAGRPRSARRPAGRCAAGLFGRNLRRSGAGAGRGAGRRGAAYRLATGDACSRGGGACARAEAARLYGE